MSIELSKEDKTNDNSTSNKTDTISVTKEPPKVKTVSEMSWKEIVECCRNQGIEVLTDEQYKAELDKLDDDDC